MLYLLASDAIIFPCSNIKSPEQPVVLNLLQKKCRKMHSMLPSDNQLHSCKHKCKCNHYSPVRPDLSKIHKFGDFFHLWQKLLLLGIFSLLEMAKI